MTIDLRKEMVWNAFDIFLNVQVTRFDVSSYDGRDTIVEKYTHHVVKNGFNPIWQHNPFKFKVDHPEIAFNTLVE